MTDTAAHKTVPGGLARHGDSASSQPFAASLRRDIATEIELRKTIDTLMDVIRTMEMRQGVLERQARAMSDQLEVQEEQIDKLNERIAKKDRNLAEKDILIGKLTERSETDSMTGIGNRRKFTETVESQISDHFSRSKHEDYDFAVIIADVNGLKKVNDIYGHGAGDDLIISVASVLDRMKRGGDIVCRLGGDEFGIVLPNTNLDEAKKFMERVRNELGHTPVVVTTDDGNVVTVTNRILLAAGASSIMTLGTHFSELKVTADEAKVISGHKWDARHGKAEISVQPLANALMTTADRLMYKHKGEGEKTLGEQTMLDVGSVA